MPRPRTNDPLGASDAPNFATDPAREQELVEEFKRRLAFIAQSYRLALELLGRDQDFNRSLARLKRSLARKSPANMRGERAHPELELVISRFARDHAEARTGSQGAEVTQQDAQAGARKAAELLKPRRGRSRNWALRYHAEGLMALLQETSGRPVQFLHVKDHVYDPQPVNAGGEILVRYFQGIDPTIAITTLATIVKDARRKFAGKPMRFLDFFPLYGAMPIEAEGSAKLQGGYRFERLEPNIPIYFP